jgi:hypothetical protein
VKQALVQKKTPKLDTPDRFGYINNTDIKRMEAVNNLLNPIYNYEKLIQNTINNQINEKIMDFYP